LARVRLFRHYFYVPYLFLSVLEFLILVSVCYAAVFLRHFGEVAFFLRHSWEPLVSVLVFGCVHVLTMTAIGVYPTKVVEGLSGMMVRTIFSIILGTIVLSFLVYVLTESLWYLRDGVLEMASVVSLFLFGISRSLFFFLIPEDNFKRKVIVLGAGSRARQLVDELDGPGSRQAIEIVGFIPVPGEVVAVDPEQTIQAFNELRVYIRATPVEEIVVALDDRRKKLPLDDLLECKMEGINIIEATTFLEREVRKLALDLLQPSWMIYSDGFGAISATQFYKRVFDIVASLALLLVTWPVMLVTALAIKLEDGLHAPVFYRQERVGLNGVTFKVTKFRSMGVDAETGGAVWAKKEDPRATRVGSFIRKVRIDELPQIFNVLVGSMAFVGPRPERPVFVEALSAKLPYYHQRHRVKPGITGWAQLCFSYADSEHDSKEKLRYDLYYIKNQSLLLDLVILIQTVEVVLFKKGSR
jgi:sugar transferase (PEP-CTERM system associated)